MAQGMPVEEVRSTCDLHSQVTRDVLVQLALPPPVEPGHPLDTFRRENVTLKQVIATMRGIFAQIADLAPIADAMEIVFRLRQSANDLMDKHYAAHDCGFDVADVRRFFAQDAQPAFCGHSKK